LEDSQQNDRRAEDTAEQVRLAIEDDLIQKGGIGRIVNGQIDPEALTEINKAIDKATAEGADTEGLNQKKKQIEEYFKALAELMDKANNGTLEITEEGKQLKSDIELKQEELKAGKIAEKDKTAVEQEISKLNDRLIKITNKTISKQITEIENKAEQQQIVEFIKKDNITAQINSANAASDVVQIYHQLHPIQSALHRMGMSLDMGHVGGIGDESAFSIVVVRSNVASADRLCRKSDITATIEPTSPAIKRTNVIRQIKTVSRRVNAISSPNFFSDLYCLFV
jgi:hypothetical protein